MEGLDLAAEIANGAGEGGLARIVGGEGVILDPSARLRTGSLAVSIWFSGTRMTLVR